MKRSLFLFVIGATVSSSLFAQTKTVASEVSVTPQTIMQKAANATADAKTMATVKDVLMEGEGEVMGNTIEVSSKVIVGSAYMFTLSAGGMEVSKEMVKDGKYSMANQGMEKELNNEDKEDLNRKTAYFADAYVLTQKGYTFTYSGTEKVEGKDAYAVKVKTAAGREYTNYYDKESGLKVKITREADAGPNGKIQVQTYYSDYKNVNGVMIPAHVKIDQGQVVIEVTFKNIKVNSGLKADDFK